MKAVALIVSLLALGIDGPVRAVGVEVAARGTVRGTVPGDDFARTLFTIWFGPEPGDENLKRGMLGKGSAS